MIVVTGAGFIGGRLIRALSAERSLDIIVADSDLTPAKRQKYSGARIADELTSAQLLALAWHDPTFSRKVDAVVHLGARTDAWERDTRLMLQDNFRYSALLLRWCLQRRIPLVYASSAAVYGVRGQAAPRRASELPPYARSKLLFDRLVEQSSGAMRAPVAGLRLCNVYGPGEADKGRMASVVFQFYRQLHDSGSIDIFTHTSLGAPGTQRRDFVHVDDVVATVIWFLDHGRSGIFDVGTGRGAAFNDIAGIVLVQEGFGVVRYVPLPADLVGWYQAFTAADLAPLRAAGCGLPFRSPEVGIPAYLPHLAAARASSAALRIEDGTT